MGPTLSVPTTATPTASAGSPEEGNINNMMDL